MFVRAGVGGYSRRTPHPTSNCPGRKAKRRPMPGTSASVLRKKTKKNVGVSGVCASFSQSGRSSKSRKLWFWEHVLLAATSREQTDRGDRGREAHAHLLIPRAIFPTNNDDSATKAGGEIELAEQGSGMKWHKLGRILKEETWQLLSKITINPGFGFNGSYNDRKWMKKRLKLL